MGGGSLEPLGERRAVHGSDAKRDAKRDPARVAGEEEEEEAVAVAVAVERGERVDRFWARDARREGETTPGKTNRPGPEPGPGPPEAARRRERRGGCRSSGHRRRGGGGHAQPDRPGAAPPPPPRPPRTRRRRRRRRRRSARASASARRSAPPPRRRRRRRLGPSRDRTSLWRRRFPGKRQHSWPRRWPGSPSCSASSSSFRLRWRWPVGSCSTGFRARRTKNLWWDSSSSKGNSTRGVPRVSSIRRGCSNTPRSREVSIPGGRKVSTLPVPPPSAPPGSPPPVPRPRGARGGGSRIATAFRTALRDGFDGGAAIARAFLSPPGGGGAPGARVARASRRRGGQPREGQTEAQRQARARAGEGQARSRGGGERVTNMYRFLLFGSRVAFCRETRNTGGSSRERRRTPRNAYHERTATYTFLPRKVGRETVTAHLEI